MLRDIIGVLPYDPNASESERAAQREAAFAFLAALDPRNPLEAMAATQIVAAEYAAMDALRHAARSDLTLSQRLRYQATAMSLTRASTAMRREIVRRPVGPAAPPATVPLPSRAPAVPRAPALPPRPASPPDAIPEKRPGSVMPMPPRPANDA
jgi:hypothetical protein